MTLPTASRQALYLWVSSFVMMRQETNQTTFNFFYVLSDCTSTVVLLFSSTFDPYEILSTAIHKHVCIHCSSSLSHSIPAYFFLLQEGSDDSERELLETRLVDYTTGFLHNIQAVLHSMLTFGISETVRNTKI